MEDGDYVLGSESEEIQRLGLQHRVWRERALKAFERAGIVAGQRVVDVGAGPGFVTQDLSALVGAEGRIVALERAPNFLNFLRAQAAPNVDVHKHDVTEPFPASDNSACWCRWLLSFADDPKAVVANIAAALKPGGAAIFHEYGSYGTWRMMPPMPLHDEFRALVMRSWRDTGGEPDIALQLPAWLEAAGLEVESIDTYCDVLMPADPAWQWPQTFMQLHADRLFDLGYVDRDTADSMASLLDGAVNRRMMTPLVVEVIARKPALAPV